MECDIRCESRRARNPGHCDRVNWQFCRRVFGMKAVVWPHARFMAWRDDVRVLGLAIVEMAKEPT